MRWDLPDLAVSGGRQFCGGRSAAQAGMDGGGVSCRFCLSYFPGGPAGAWRAAAASGGGCRGLFAADQRSVF